MSFADKNLIKIWEVNLESWNGDWDLKNSNFFSLELFCEKKNSVSAVLFAFFDKSRFEIDIERRSFWTY